MARTYYDPFVDPFGPPQPYNLPALMAGAGPYSPPPSAVIPDLSTFYGEQGYGGGYTDPGSPYYDPFVQQPATGPTTFAGGGAPPPEPGGGFMGRMREALANLEPQQPGISLDYSTLDALIAQLSGMFGPEGRAEYLTPFRTAGTQQIGRGVSAANRAIASRLAASGIGDSGIATSAIGGSFEAGNRALAELYGGLATAGLDYDRLQAGAISSAAGFEAQRQALELQEFATQEEADLARDRLEADIRLRQSELDLRQPNELTEWFNTILSGLAVGGLFI